MTMTSERTLLLGSPGATADAIAAAKKSNGTSALEFEMLHRLESLRASSCYTQVLAGSIGVPAFVLPKDSLSLVLLALSPGGSLQLTELLVSEFSVSKALHEISPSIPSRTPRSLASDLTLCGFTGIKTAEETPMTAVIIEEAMGYWSVPEDKQETARDLLLTHGKIVKTLATKPAFEVGSVAKLSFGKKRAVASVPVFGKDRYSSCTHFMTDKFVLTETCFVIDPSTDSKTEGWKVSASKAQFGKEDDEELEDEEALLDDADRAKPTVQRMSFFIFHVWTNTHFGHVGAPDASCETRKKACKNCSCGRAEQEMEEEEEDSKKSAKKDSDAIVVVKSSKNMPISSCGSCYLGDAFRCSTCPYIGMPAFKPGEQVVLKGNLLDDDF